MTAHGRIYAVLCFGHTQHIHEITLSSQLYNHKSVVNKKFELMLTRRAKAYSSSSLVV